jgi:hypothetical protein
MEWTGVVCCDGGRQVGLLRREQSYLESAS